MATGFKIPSLQRRQRLKGCTSPCREEGDDLGQLPFRHDLPDQPAELDGLPLEQALVLAQQDAPGLLGQLGKFGIGDAMVVKGVEPDQPEEGSELTDILVDDEGEAGDRLRTEQGGTKKIHRRGHGIDLKALGIKREVAKVDLPAIDPVSRPTSVCGTS